MTTCLTTSEKSSTEYPGLAKFGIALDLGSRDRGFKSRSPDQDKWTFFQRPLIFFHSLLANECMFSIFDEILDFLGDAAAFNKMDIGKALAEFLENSGFAGINVRSDSNDKSAHIYASKDMYEYIFYLERRWPEKQICSDEDDSADEDYEPFEYETDEVNSYFDEFKEIFEQEVKGETYQFQLSPDLTRLSAVIRQNWDNHYLTVRLCNSDLTLENWIFKNIVCYWLEAEFSQNCFLENLKGHRFHLSLGDRGKIEAYKEGLKFEIEVSSKRIIDFDNMDGHAFEHFCAEILSFYGFNNVQVTQGSGDQGVDIIAYKDDIKYGIKQEKALKSLRL